MKVAVIVALMLIGTGFLFRKELDTFFSKNNEENISEVQKDQGSKKEAAAVVGAITVVKKWNLPTQLQEVSGIAYLDENRFACVQDEEGIIFIFNKATSKIEKQIAFAGRGDYEGIALKGNTAYVVRSDGRLYEVDLNAGKASVKTYDTPLTAKHNIEGLCYDEMNNRLLLAIKDKDPHHSGYKTVYAFALSSNKMLPEPVISINLAGAIFKTAKGKQKEMMPSDIGIHPRTKEVFVLDGPHARLLVMDEKMRLKNLYTLGKSFAQPEGITFSPDGAIYISNEGTKQSGNIIQVAIGGGSSGSGKQQ